jgi:putative cell wall-binding protein
MRAPLRLRYLLSLGTAVVLTVAMIPSAALGATSVSATHSLNWGSNGSGDGEFDYLSDVAVDKWGNVYVAGGQSGDHRVQVFTSAGTFVEALDDPGANPGQVTGPWTITTDRWGNIYIGDTVNSRVTVYNPELYSYLRTIDGSGDAVNVYPTGVGVSLGLDVYTADALLQNVRRWDWYGGLVRTITPGGLPRGIAVSQEGEVYTTQDAGTNGDKIIVYDASLDYSREWGSTGTGTLQFDRPFDVDVDAAENVFVADFNNDRVQTFDGDGTYKTTLGSSGSGDTQLSRPAGVGVSLSRDLYVADSYNYRVSKWQVSTPTLAEEVAGTSRYKTAQAISQKAYPTGSAPEYIVVATGLNWPDALGGAALAGALKAPLLLTTPDVLSPEVIAEIARLNPDYAVVLGGESAISPTVFAQLQVLVGLTDVTRLGGGSRYETANLIAEAVVEVAGTDGTAFVVTGETFPDALAASPIAAANGWPIYLTPSASLSPAVKAAMIANGSNHGYIIGGESAVSSAIQTELNGAPFIGFGRVAGTNRYSTAAAVAEAGFDGMGMLWSRPAIATGENFPDALAGGVLQGSDYTLLLLTPKDSLHPATAAALAGNKDMIYELRFLGGTGAVSTATRNAAKALLW